MFIFKKVISLVCYMTKTNINLLDLDNDILNIIGGYVKHDNNRRIRKDHNFNETQHARCVRGHAGQDTVRRRSSFIQTPPVYPSWDDN